ncbi:MAG TPA: acyl-[acyl-carrier-protein]--UDP-N-acetylglucosamine O-acyltransferase [Verrucomicrobia bacterium]|nr:MAG: acyl-[acyl-carrier-protein]--UDP-N-acetylglucosamine O-acyltransferase [Lentisphaerae bacterium GWF2_57_35]HBA83259.1 acyl-[acyl-carrier-protein]--UDP-N-acetylglucosamine O-acyltransferase [Verrucomicrobiota bacterium]
MAVIHPSAVVAPEAVIDDSATIGPYCVIGPHVQIGARTRLLSHVVVDGWTSLGADCIVFPFASLGMQTQDLKYKGGAPRVEIGDQTTIREYVTVNAATFDGESTRVGSQCHIMAYAHIAHDCKVGNGVIMANAATLAGHVTVEDQVGIGGMCGIHQFVRLGRLCYLGGMTKATQDIPPFMIADGNPLGVHTINSEGLKRRGISESSQQLLKKAYKILYREGLSTRQATEKIEAELEQNTEVQYLVSFIKNSERGITK